VDFCQRFGFNDFLIPRTPHKNSTQHTEFGENREKTEKSDSGIPIKTIPQKDPGKWWMDVWMVVGIGSAQRTN